MPADMAGVPSLFLFVTTGHRRKRGLRGTTHVTG